MDFADSITVDDMTEWTTAVQELQEKEGAEVGDGEKKSL